VTYSPAPNRYIWVPAHTYEALQDLQHRILTYQVDPDVARGEMESLLTPHLDRPLSPTDRVEILLKTTPMSYKKAP
jgi:hypothetical protein